MHHIDPARLDLARDFKAQPLGPHSPDLQKLLKILRWDPVEGRVVAVQPERDGPWYLARLTGPKGHPVEIFRQRAYATLLEAYWALFRRRWEDHTGQALVLDEAERLDPPPAHGELTLTATRKPILGYADKFSVENGHAIGFKVHADEPGSYQATILRLRSADHAGVGLKTAVVETPVNRAYHARRQTIETGSFVEVGQADAFDLSSFTLLAYIWPTTPAKGRQAIVGNWDETSGRGYMLAVDDSGAHLARRRRRGGKAGGQHERKVTRTALVSCCGQLRCGDRRSLGWAASVTPLRPRGRRERRSLHFGPTARIGRRVSGSLPGRKRPPRRVLVRRLAVTTMARLSSPRLPGTNTTAR